MELSMDFLFLQRNQSCWTSSLRCVRTILNLNYSYNLYSHTIKAWRIDVWIWGRYHSVRDTLETACQLSIGKRGTWKRGMDTHTSNPGIQEVEAGEAGVQGRPQLLASSRPL